VDPESNIIDTDFTSYGEWLIFAYARADGTGGVAKARECQVSGAVEKSLPCCSPCVKIADLESFVATASLPF
jgi:hypothetical protein